MVNAYAAFKLRCRFKILPCGGMENTFMIKTIGVLTSGGDAPGMNAAVRAVVRAALKKGMTVYGVKRGYCGLLDDDIEPMDEMSVAGIINRGGTMLYTARSAEFRTEEGVLKAKATCEKYGLEGLVVIGGDGSFRGAADLSAHGILCVGLPGTIDNDIACTDYTIGYDTAMNTAMELMDKLSDTSQSHYRCSVVEVMGRSAGYIALWCGIANGAEEILLPEKFDNNYDALLEQIHKNRELGMTHQIVVNAEGVGHSDELAKRIEEATGIETRATILGHLQRGGSPTARDRFYASMMGAYAVDVIDQGRKNRLIGYKNGKLYDVGVEEAFAM